MKKLITTLFLSCLFCLLVPPQCVQAGEDAVSWSKVSLPAAGKSGGWVLAEGADPDCLTQASDGTLYCYATPEGIDYTLFKSTDAGLTWSSTGSVKNNIIDIAVSPENADVIYYCTAAAVYRSDDAGDSFQRLPNHPGGAGSDNISLTAIDVIYFDGGYLVAAATADTDAAQFGGVYLYDEQEPETGWTDTGVGSCDVYDVAFVLNPAFEEYHLVAAVNDETSTMITARVGDADWGSEFSDVVLMSGTLVGADIAFGDDYSAELTIIVGLNTGSGDGDVYLVYIGAEDPSYADIDAGRPSKVSNVDIGSVAVIGDSRNATIIAGAAGSAMVYFSLDGGARWAAASKPPSGLSGTALLASADYLQTAKIYAATQGTSGGFSVSTDYGLTWNQVSMIDTQISTVVDLAPSPDFSSDHTLFVLTYGGSQHSLWRSENAGTHWSRVFSSGLSEVMGLDYVVLSPEYGAAGRTVFVTGTSSDGPAVWRSADYAASFGRPHVTYDPDIHASFNIMQCVPLDDNTLLLGSFDGTNGVVYRADFSDWGFSEKAILGTAILNSIAVSPAYSEDQTVLAGNKAGWLFLSEDGGNSFAPLPDDVTAAPLSGGVSVSFDPDFSFNHKVYAASDTASKGIFRYDIEHSTKWESIDGTLPSGAIINRLSASITGTLYALNNKTGGGLERGLDPSSTSPVFETLTRNLDTTARLDLMKISGDHLWAVDTANCRLMTMQDTLTRPVVLKEPENEASGLDTAGVKIDWKTTAGASTYEWQVDTDKKFTTVPSDFTDTTQSTSARLSELEPATTYYWRVRATGPVLSPWSVRRSFTTVLNGDTGSLQIISPTAGDIVPLQPVFQWSAVASAENYELLIASDNAFNDIFLEKSGSDALAANAWQCDIGLLPGTTYYWKVRASGTESYSSWSDVGVFITEAEIPVTTAAATTSVAPAAAAAPVTTTVIMTVPTVSLPPATTTQIIQLQQSGSDRPEWWFYLGGTLVVIIIIILVILLVMMVRRGRD